MFSGIQMTAVPTDANLANNALLEENTYRFQAFSAEDAITLVQAQSLTRLLAQHLILLRTEQGLSIRKRFRASSRHGKGKGLVISIQTIAGHTLFSCTVGDLGHPSGIADVSLNTWACLEGMVDVVKRTSHSSYFVEKGMSAMGKTAKQIGLDEDTRVTGGGRNFLIFCSDYRKLTANVAFPIWLEVCVDRSLEKRVQMSVRMRHVAPLQLSQRTLVHLRMIIM